ncbi:pickpocket protein 28-like [Condylostylus longicornis]|uniref:pickpocket protein 28-like n=1 Tax=Condylostylus longicornis TaxID=2530218 RepID=UPI00244E26A2|nr:pickpocket protein 28-like [Condylostylus longicornis]
MVKKSNIIEIPTIPNEKSRNRKNSNGKNSSTVDIPEDKNQIINNTALDGAANVLNYTKPLEKTPSDASALHLIKKGTKIQVLRGIIADYSDATSIHGIKYFGSRNKRWYERIIWFSLVLASMYYGTILTIQTWTNWYNNPVIVGLAESSTPIWEIPFPAVTICPLIKYQQYYKNDDNRNEMPMEDIQKLEAISHVCIINLLFFEKFNFPNHSTLNEQISRAKSSVIQNTNKIVKWRKSELINFKDEIKYVLTDDGVCFSFNALDDSKIFRDPNFGFQRKNFTRKIPWTLEKGYKKKAGTTTYPRRVLAGDVDEGFYVKLKANLQDTDNSCGGKSQGYKIILHTPNELPLVSKRFFRVPYKQIISVAVKPNMITTSKDVRSYDPEKRQCFFNNEKYLKYFKIYTQANCEHECYTNATQIACNCTKFYMPRDPLYDYCGATDIKCYREVRKNLLKVDGFKTICNCLPACTSIAYDSEVTQSLLKDNGSNYDTQNEFARSIMNVYFAKNQFLSAKRSELYGIADLVANIGGLFGLFMGVSILSLVEIIYFCTLRLCVNMKMRKKAKKKLEEKAKRRESKGISIK